MVNLDITVKESVAKESLSQHLWIDIFPIDGAPDSADEFRKRYKKAYFYRAFIKVGNYKFLSGGKTLRKRLMKMVAKPFVEILHLDDLMMRKLIELSKSGPSYEEARWVAGLRWAVYGEKERFKKELIQCYVTVDFEGHRFPALMGWDELLTGLYGDYMQLPPEEKRTTHGMTAWWSQDNPASCSQ